MIRSILDSTPLAEFIDINDRLITFAGDVTLCEIFDSFTEHLHDAVVIVEEEGIVGVLTMREMMRILSDFENLMRPVREFMLPAPAIYDSAQTAANLLSACHDTGRTAVLIQHDNAVVALIDPRDLLLRCYDKLC